MAGRGIVVGVDRSAAAGAALEWALAEAGGTGQPVRVLHAWVEPVVAGYPMVALGADPEAVEAAAFETAEQAVKSARERVPADGVDIAVETPHGGAAAVLAQASGTADLVVVGTRSHGALSRAVLGSVSASVLHHSTAPVVVVPEPAEHDDHPARVLVGVDHSPASLLALQWAADHAARRGLALVPVLVHEPVPAAQADGRRTDVARLEASERRALLDAVPAGTATDVQPEVVVGHAAGALLALARPQDVLVVGSRGRGGFSGLLLGSTSSAVAQHAPCPVVVVRGREAPHRS